MNHHLTQAQSGSATPREEPPRARPLGLVVDDDIVTRAVLADVLDEAGFEVMEAGDGQHGLGLFEDCPPDLVLLDVAMPGLDGYAVCERMRTLPHGAHVPIVMLTGLDDDESIERAYAAGATDFIGKPCNIALLRHRLRYLMRAQSTADELRASEAGLARAQRLAGVGSWEIDLATEAFMPSEETRRMLFGAGHGLPLVLDDLLARVVDDERAAVGMAIRAALAARTPLTLDFDVITAHDKVAALHLDMEMHAGERRGAPRAMGTFVDLTTQRASERRIRELAFFDTITGLPNRAFFMERLAETLAAAQRFGREFAVMFIDLDQFKRVNDTLGHAAGDDLLREVATRIGNALRKADTVTRPGDGPETVARLGGDEFVVLLAEIRRAEDAAIVARRILQQLERPCLAGGTEVAVSGSIGISTYPRDGTDATSLLKRADIAMYRVKTDGRNAYRFYTPELNMRVVERLTVEASLKRALERREFELHYQPQIDLGTGRVVGAEALVRWRNPDIGMVWPADFIPLAQETGVMAPLSAWILEQACADARQWADAHGLALRVAVNLAAGQLLGDGFVTEVERVLATTRLPADQLELELTEAALMHEPEPTLAVLNMLHTRGVRLTLDDFGSGHVSLNFLKRLPLATLKIDRCFVQDLPRDAADLAIVRGTVALAHNLRMQVLAEAVEDAAQLACLESAACDLAQGYHYSPPLPLDEFVRWVVDHHAHPTVRKAG